MTTRCAVLLLVLLAWPAQGLADTDTWSDDFDWGEAPTPEPDPWIDASPADGKRLFRTLCTGCHGAEGKGDGPVASSMFPRPRDLTSGVYKFRSTASGTLPTREDMLRTVTDGLPGTEMPSWGPQLKDEQLRSLVLYLERLAPRFATQGRKDSDVLVGELVAPEATPELLERGKQVYTDMKCATCHGERGRGDGEAARNYGQKAGSDTEVFDFTWGVYKGGATAEALVRTFVTGLDGTPMPSYVDSLPEERDRWALALYCLSLTRPRGLLFYLTERPTWYEPAAPKPRERPGDRQGDEAAPMLAK